MVGRLTSAILFALLLVALIPFAVTAQDTTPEPADASLVAPSPIAAEALPILVSARSDLELLAQSQLGAERPTGWNGSLNTNDAQLPILVRLDLELLAGHLLGIGERPVGWFGAIGSSPYAVARDVRHDLELLADRLIQPGVRPPGWVGSDPVMRCSRATQSLVRLLERDGYVVQSNVDSPTFCADVEIEVSRYVEQTLLAAPPAGPAPSLPESPALNDLSGSIREGLRGAAVFADRNASERLGVLPAGVPFAALARSTAQFSNMMLVEGADFRVFVDYTFTNVGLAQFETLPGLSAANTQTYCQAEWCD